MYEEARQTASRLRNAVPPARLPVLPGVDLSARSLLSQAAATSEWFDTVVLDDGRIALTVGDVVGDGARASWVKDRLCAALSMALQGGADPAAAIGLLEKFASQVPGADGTTVCAAVLDPATGDLTYCAAGHPPPLIASAGDSARYVEPSGGTPLGEPGGSQLGHDHLELDDVLLLYTDEMLERPQRTPDKAITELRTAAVGAAPGHSADSFTERVLELVAGHSDNVMVLAAHRRTPVVGLRRSGPAVADTAARLRDEFAAWLRAQEPEPVVVIGVESAVIELMANVIEHAYYDRALGPVTLTADLVPSGELAISVRDRGRWKDSKPAVGRGHGLALAGATVDHLRVERTPEGTTATVRTALTKAASLLVDESQPATEQTELSAAVADGRLLVTRCETGYRVRRTTIGPRMVTRAAVDSSRSAGDGTSCRVW